MAHLHLQSQIFNLPLMYLKKLQKCWVVMANTSEINHLVGF